MEGSLHGHEIYLASKGLLKCYIRGSKRTTRAEVNQFLALAGYCSISPTLFADSVIRQDTVFYQTVLRLYGDSPLSFELRLHLNPVSWQFPRPNGETA